MRELPAPSLPEWLGDMLPFARLRVDVGEHALHVMSSGTGEAVLLLHGNPTWGFLWRKVAAALADDPLRLVMPDLVGLGFSDKPRRLREHQLDDHGRWIEELVTALELQRFVLVGQNWGGPIGLRMVAARPERLAGLVLANTVVGPPRPGFRPTAFHRFARIPLVSTLAFRFLGFPLGSLHRAQGDPRSLRGQVAAAYRYPLRSWRDRVAPLALARMVPHAPHHPSMAALVRCQDAAEAFRGPSALVWGERDPILGRSLKRVASLLPQAEVTTTGAGHFLQEEVPEIIAGAVRKVAAQAFA
jgi:cis-3-alkyl-4-acyloxetan-2-one decarboxylase